HGRHAPGSAVVRELDGEVEVGALHQCDDGLQVVARLARHAQLVALDLHLDALGALIADELAQLLGLLGADALPEGAVDLDVLAGLAWLAGLEGLEADAALDQLALEHVQHGSRSLLGVRGDLDPPLAAPGDRGAGVLEVVSRRDLLGRLVEGVVGLLAVDLADDVEGGIGHGPHPKAIGAGDSGGGRFRRPDPAGVILATVAAGCPSGQRELTVNQPALPSEVRILYLPRGMSPRPLPGAHRVRVGCGRPGDALGRAGTVNACPRRGSTGARTGDSGAPRSSSTPSGPPAPASVW